MAVEAKRYCDGCKKDIGNFDTTRTKYHFAFAVDRKTDVAGGSETHYKEFDICGDCALKVIHCMKNDLKHDMAGKDELATKICEYLKITPLKTAT